MAFKEFQLDELPVKIFKRKGNRSMRLSVTANGDVRVSIPTWVPYAAGVDFARKKKTWILAQRSKQPAGLLVEGQAIGKAHRLSFVAEHSVLKPTARLVDTTIVIRHPFALAPDSPAVQQTAAKAALEALRAQASHLLPQRLQSLAKTHGYIYSSVNIKQLKSRWGSCDQSKNITLNLFLMQLPWECIDYVLMHELAHTEVMRHGQPFWDEMERHMPNVQQLRKHLRAYQPILHASLPLAVS
jgi:predicted metal-dependent hydrolase